MQDQDSKKKRGCMIAAIVVAALMLPCIGGAVFLTYQVSQNEDVQQVGKFFGTTIELSRKAQTAPGTAELRAEGCQQAMIMSSTDFKEMIEIIEKDPAKVKAVDFDLVQCALPLVDQKEISCDRVAQIYVGATTTASPRFMAQVTAPGEPKARCAALYNDKGEKIQDVDAENAPKLNVQ
jgi:hypothetical protein